MSDISRTRILRDLRRSRGSTFLYATVLMVAMCAFVSLGVDIGRVQVAKTELQRAADAAARYGALGLSTSTTQAQSNAIAAAAQNTADGSSVAITGSDISFGYWNTSTRTFVVSASTISAIRVTAQRTGNSAIPLLFGRVVGRSTCSLTAQSIATFTPAVSVNQIIPATGNPFLSGMTAGSMASSPNPPGNPDFAGTSSSPRQSPVLANMPISGGEVITFDSINGNAANGPGITDSGPNGNTSSIGHNNLTTSASNNTSSNFYNENGIADGLLPINCTCGVFLDDNAPNLSPAPASNLNFSTPASRDFASLSPTLKQVFFIGTGVSSAGAKQQFVAPPGATRLYLATWDFYEWSNNSGARNVIINRVPKVSLVK